MQVDSYLVPECIARPRSFGGLMTLYEANFIKLHTLLGKHRPAEGGYCSTVPGDCDLHLQVHEQTRYTCTFTLTYWFDEPHGAIADPDLSGRIYYDARMVEVRDWAAHHKHAGLISLSDAVRSAAGPIETRWTRNIMFSKWLDYLDELGHGFQP